MQLCVFGIPMRGLKKELDPGQVACTQEVFGNPSPKSFAGYLVWEEGLFSSLNAKFGLRIEQYWLQLEWRDQAGCRGMGPGTDTTKKLLKCLAGLSHACWTDVPPGQTEQDHLGIIFCFVFIRSSGNSSCFGSDNRLHVVNALVFSACHLVGFLLEVLWLWCVPMEAFRHRITCEQRET